MIQYAVMKRQLADLTLYRLRYILGYGLLGLLFVGAVIIASVYTPGGLTQAEIDNLETTISMPDSGYAVTNLPFHLMQLASLSLFGVSIFSIKLPAILLSIVASVAIFFLLRRWFKSNVAVLSMLIMTTTGQYIYIAQSATSHILYITFTALILLFASLTIQKASRQLLWKIGLALSVGLSWYTPYFIYITLGLLIVALIHPHTRHHIFKKRERPNWFIASAVFIAAIAPLAYLYATNQSLITSLIGYESLSVDIVGNLKTLLMTFFWVEPVVVYGQILPILDFSSVALILLGVMVLFRQSYTSRSYMIVAWLLLTLPVVLFRPHLVSIISIPLFILLALGVETLLSEWYKLFPKNPYARGAGLVLLVGLIGIMTISGIDRFVNGYRYSPDAARAFSSDLTLVKRQLSERPVRTLLVVGQDELPVYEALNKFSSYDILVTTDTNDDDIGNALVTRAGKEKIPDDWQLQRIFTNDRAEESDRLYLYKTFSDRV